MIQPGRIDLGSEAEATRGRSRFPEWLGDRRSVSSSDPGDDTPVRTTELGEAAPG